MYLKYRAAWSP